MDAIMPIGGGDPFGDVHWVRRWLTRQLHLRAHHQPNPLTLDHPARSVLAFSVFHGSGRGTVHARAGRLTSSARATTCTGALRHPLHQHIDPFNVVPLKSFFRSVTIFPDHFFPEDERRHFRFYFRTSFHKFTFILLAG
ncbi:hypothetical protein PAHAL_2G352000 [Panicum hallii]|jgi:hypothetical protein|uniref:Uncharacterized protein n=1 Tax=Panicum hallii TaxID=206008 RepID=A0A2T8KRD6_9POAL|nr:hypothetical protein PAHAL_2G352000 [Panicum hallii]